MPVTKTVKAERTRQRILSMALKLFLNLGYEKTTMRAIAASAEQSPGAAYYYFNSKEDLIQVFYDQTQEEHFQATREILAQKTSFHDRLLDVINKKIEIAEPYHEISRALFKTAADPTSSLSPFHKDTSGVRQKSITLFREVIEGSTTKIPEDLKDRLPEYLWLYHMGIILYWLYDFSPGKEKTLRLIQKTVDIIVKLLAVANLPGMKPVRRAVIRILEEFRPDK